MSAPPTSPPPPGGIRSRRGCVAARCASRRPAPLRDDGTLDVLEAAGRLGMPVVTRRRARAHGARTRIDDRAHAQLGRRSRPRARRPSRRPVPPVVAARSQGAARRVGQLLRLPHEPARVAGAACRAGVAGVDRRHGGARRRAVAHLPVDRRRRPDPSEPDRHPPRHRRAVRVHQHPDGGVDRRVRHHRAQRRGSLDRAQPAPGHGHPRRAAGADDPPADRGEGDPRRRRAVQGGDRRLGDQWRRRRASC